MGGKGGKRRPTSSPRPSGLHFTKNPSKPVAGPKREQAEPGLGCAFPANAAAAAQSSGEETRAAKLPAFKAGRAWRRLARKLRSAAWGPCSQNRAGLPRRCRPALAGTSLSTSFCGGRAGHASSEDLGWQASALRGSLYQGGSSGGPATGDQGRTCWGREAHLPLPVTEIRRGGARVHRRWAAHSVGSGVPHGE